MISKINLNELTVDNIVFWPLPIKCLVIVLGFLLIGIGIYSSVLDELVKRYKEVHTEAINLQATLHQQTQLLDQQIALENKLKTSQKQWETTIQNISSAKKMADLLADITRLGIQEGLEFKTIHPLIEQLQGELNILPIEFTIEGNYQQIKHFLLQLIQFKKNIQLQNFKLVPINLAPNLNVPKVDSFSLTLLINIYRLQNEGFLFENFDKETKQSSQLDKPLQGAANFLADNLDGLKMVGYLRQGETQWALLAVPDKEVYRVNVGSILHKPNIRVIKITPYKVELLMQTQGMNQNLTLHLRG